MFSPLANWEIYCLQTLNFGLLRKEKHENKNKRQTKIKYKKNINQP